MATLRRSRLAPWLAGAVVFVLTILVIVGFHGKGEQAQQQVPVTLSPAAPASPLPSAASSVPSAGSSMPVNPTTSDAPNPLQPVPLPKGTEAFKLTIGTALPVANSLQCSEPFIVNAQEPSPQGGLFTPPEPDQHDWCGTSAWYKERPVVDPKTGKTAAPWTAYPAYPSEGLTAIYIHSCRTHQCPGTFIQCVSNCTHADSLHDKTYTVKTGEQITITTPTGVLVGRVCGIGSSPKSGNLQVPQCSTPVNWVIANCEYETGETSVEDIVEAVTLVKSTPNKA